MNDLSWILYWADALPSLALFVCMISFSIAAICFYFSIDYFSYKNETWGKDENGQEKYTPKAQAVQALWWAPYALLAALVLCGASFMVPSRNTFYLIAASEMGEEAVKTPEFAKLRGVVNKFLDDQLKVDQPKGEQ